MHFPRWPGRAGFAVEELARRHGDFAVAGAAVAVALTPSGGVERAAIALFGIGSTPVRTSAAERDLVGTTPSAADLVEIGERALVDIDPVADLHTSGAYRKSVAAAIVTRALTNAIEEAQRA